VSGHAREDGVTLIFWGEGGIGSVSSGGLTMGVETRGK